MDTNKTNLLRLNSLPYLLIVGILLMFGIFIYYSVEAMETMKEKKDNKHPYYSLTDTQKISVPDGEWKKVLDPELYHIAREKGTERAFTGKYWDFEGSGVYHCAACGYALFRSHAKFASQCGWPSFFEAIRPGSLVYKEDLSHGMQRIEVCCGRCDAHLGHVFADGPPPTHMRYCMNSLSLDFFPETQQ